MSTRYFKWESEHGTAYGKLPIDYAWTHFLGATATHIVSIPVNDPSLIELDESQFSAALSTWKGLEGLYSE